MPASLSRKLTVEIQCIIHGIRKTHELTLNLEKRRCLLQDMNNFEVFLFFFNNLLVSHVQLSFIHSLLLEDLELDGLQLLPKLTFDSSAIKFAT